MSVEATVTSKGQVTIPKEVRRSLKLKSGEKIVFVVRGREAIMMPKVKNPIEELRKMRSEIRFTQKEIKEMVRESKKAWSKFG